jgi:hypothetical protein
MGSNAPHIVVPSLRLGAVQALYATKIKKDPADHTTGISVLIVSAPNCDFDGDACYDIMIKEMGQVPHIMKNLHPMVTMLCSSGGLALSGDVKMSDQCVVAMHTWISSDPDVQAYKLPA